MKLKIYLIIIILLINFLLSDNHKSTYIEKETSQNFVITSSLTLFIITYFGTLSGEFLINNYFDFPELFVPGIGSMIAAFRADTFERTAYWPTQEKEKYLLALSGILQTICLINVIRVFYDKVKDDRFLTKDKKKIKISFEPLGLLGIQVVYRH